MNDYGIVPVLCTTVKNNMLFKKFTAMMIDLLLA